jgi:transposase InsO family protein
VAGCLIAERESAALAEKLLAKTIAKQRIVRDQLTVHADRGTSMASKPVALLLADLGVTKTHSRPHCSNDNPYSEAGFKTLNYRPDFPERFGCIQHAGTFCQGFSAGTTPRTATPLLKSAARATAAAARLGCPHNVETSVRHDALRGIPGGAGRDSKGGPWVRWLTWNRKGKGLRDPRDMAKA